MAEAATRLQALSPRRRVLLLMGLAALLITGTLFLTDQHETEIIVITFPGGKTIDAEVANTPEKLLFGLAFRDALPPDSGMLYIFETSDRHRLRTKGFKIPVDMIWADENRRVVHVVTNAEPCREDPCPFYGPPPQNSAYVIQTAAGFVEAQRIVPGMELKFALRL
jgi:uncharacterized membrane protein (UPF0127 family)